MLKLWRTTGIAAVRSTARTPCPACHSRALSSSSSLSASTTRATSIPPPSIDLAPLLNDPDKVKQNLVDRKYPLGPEVVDEIQSLEMDSRRLKRDIQRIRERRNAVSGFPPAAKPGSAAPGSTGGPSEASLVKTRLKALTLELSTITTRLSHLSLQLPNTSSPSSPIGSESAAVIVHTLGPSISSPPPPAQPLLDHLRLSSPSHLAWTDFPSSSLITGASWSLLTNEGALLEMALTQYAFAKTIAHGFSPVLTPDVVRSDIADRCGFRPRDGEAQQTYFLEDGTKEPALCLVGTAEVPLVAMSAAMVFEEDKLPLKQVALGRAFRAEAGARGADSRGLYRVHQFSKVEIVVVCKQEDSDGILEDLRRIQEDILGDLGLSLRVLDMPTEELGASAHRKYDIEGWMPGRGKWGELSSASNCTDFQSRRLSIRYRPTPSSSSFTCNARPPLEDLDIPTPAAFEATASYPSQTLSGTPKTMYAHTLNATAAAIPRLIVALLENGAVLEAENVIRVRLPAVLKKYWLGKEDGKIEWVESGEALKQ